MSNSNPEEKSQSVDPKQLGITEERIRRFKKAFEAKMFSNIFGFSTGSGISDEAPPLPTALLSDFGIEYTGNKESKK